MNSEVRIKQDIQNNLKTFDQQLIRETSISFLNTLGYYSKRIGRDEIDNDRFERFIESALDTANPSQKLCIDDWQSFHTVFQVADAEIKDQIRPEPEKLSLFESLPINDTLRYSYMFVTVKLSGETYNRTQLANMTRFINKEFQKSIMVMFMYGTVLSIAIINRRKNLRDSSKQVLEKVTLIKDINLKNPKRAHIDIISELHLQRLIENEGVKNFDTLHDAWEVILNTEALNKRFYHDLETWYDWSKTECKFPDKENKMQVIRMITRLLFIWFLKEKRLVPEDIFEEEGAKKHLNNFDFDTSDYYQAILQNLFFATLNTPIIEREFRTINQQAHTHTSETGHDSRIPYNPDHRNANKYRYADLLKNGDGFLEHLKQVPFVNGGLFDSLDSFEGKRAGGKRVDCFTDWPNHRKQLHVPAKVFFEEENGIFDIFSHYKFTVEENTPVDQEVALDPELLGQVFENLLGVYNPESEELARKETGSYYTPRQVVDYMIDEALIAYLLQKVTPYDNDKKDLEDRLREDLLVFDQLGEKNKLNDHLIHDDEIQPMINAIDELKILDPAVGSGAFPMGILNKLVLILKKLDPENERWKQRQVEVANNIPDPTSRAAALERIDEVFSPANQYNNYGRKLYLIQNSIYGVDIQTIAVTIAKLRFFISLVIEQERSNDPNDENYGIRALPNLETKFVAANTLIGLNKLHQSDLQSILEYPSIKQLRQEIDSIRKKYFSENDRQKKLEHVEDEENHRKKLAEVITAEHIEVLEEKQRDIDYQIEQLKNEDAKKVIREKLEKKYKASEAELTAAVAEAKLIADWNPYNQNEKADFFDIEWMFGIMDGFDVVIGNPPYAKSENVPEDKREQLTAYYGWGGDLYDYFIFAGFNFVSEQGVFTYIANDSYVTFSTKRRIRDQFLQNRLLHLVKAPANTFEATIYTAIFILLKQTVNDSHAYMSGEINFPDFEYHSNGAVEYATIHEIPDRKFLLSGINDWVLRLFALEKVKKYCQVLDTGIHSGNVRKKIFFKEDNGSRNRLLQGKQIQRYSIQWDSPKAEYKYCDINYVPLPIPGIGRGGKPSKKSEYWTFGKKDIENHHQPERLLMRQTDDDLIVAYHSEAELGRFYTDNTLHTILPKSQKTNLKYFMALFNSRLMNKIYHSISQEQGKSQAQVKIKVVRELPVVVPIEEEQTPIITLVDQILDAKQAKPDADTSDLENEIDKLVYALYNLTEDEIAIMEGSV